MSNVSENVLGDFMFDDDDVGWSDRNINYIYLSFSVCDVTTVFNFCHFQVDDNKRRQTDGHKISFPPELNMKKETRHD